MPLSCKALIFIEKGWPGPYAQRSAINRTPVYIITSVTIFLLQNDRRDLLYSRTSHLNKIPPGRNITQRIIPAPFESGDNLASHIDHSCLQVFIKSRYIQHPALYADRRADCARGLFARDG